MSKPSAPPATQNRRKPRILIPRPPDHLSAEAAKWWREVLRDYVFEAHTMRLLQAAAEAWDRAQEARRAISEHGGLTMTTARGELKAHPAVAIERDSRMSFLRLVRELGIEDAEPGNSGR